MTLETPEVAATEVASRAVEDTKTEAGIRIEAATEAEVVTVVVTKEAETVEASVVEEVTGVVSEGVSVEEADDMSRTTKYPWEAMVSTRIRPDRLLKHSR